ALTASTPMAALVAVAGFRGAVLAVGGVGLIAAFGIAFVPARALNTAKAPPSIGLDVEGESLAAADAPRAEGVHIQPTGEAAVGSLRGILRARAFWRYAPQAALFTGGFMALQGLWAGAWLTEVEGRSRAGAAGILFLFNLALLAGQLCSAFGGRRLAAAGVSRRVLLTGGLALALVGEGAIVMRGLWICQQGCGGGPLWGWATLPWLVFGFFSAASAQVYGVTAGDFPAALSGRVTTAVNQLAFLGAFVLQWGIGASIESWGGADPAARIEAFGRVFGVLWLLQMVAIAWSVRRGPRSAAGDAAEPRVKSLG
ncbi:MAG TPA: hypothetical protein VGG33_17315, partial [Polyangia bacterium]